MTKPITAIMSTVLALAACGAGAAHAALNPMHCYEVARRGPIAAAQPRIVTLEYLVLGTFLGLELTVNAQTPKRICNPANVVAPVGDDRGGTSNGDHLAGYEILRTDPRLTRIEDVTVEDQFGTHVIDLIRPVLFLVPTAKSENALPPPPVEPTIDHYTCFIAKGHRFRTDAPLTLTDQFHAVDADIKRPAWFCIASQKNEEPVLDLTEHSMCYFIRTRPRRPAVDEVFIRNQVHAATIDPTRSRELCVPARIVDGEPTPCGLEPDGLTCGGDCSDDASCLWTGSACECTTATCEFGDGQERTDTCGGFCPRPSDICVDAKGCQCVDGE